LINWLNVLRVVCLLGKEDFEEFASVEISSNWRTWTFFVHDKLNISPVRFFANGETEANKTSLDSQLQTAPFFTAE
jgi:hypothetical protein